MRTRTSSGPPSRTRRTRRNSGPRRRRRYRAARTRTPRATGSRFVSTRSRYGNSRCGILVQILHVGVRRRAVDVEVVLLDVLAVVALAVGEPEQPLFQDRVPLVPERERKAQPLLVVGDSAQAVFAPPVGARARLVVREVVPRVAVLAVVLADRAPLPLAEVGSPFLPRDARLARVVQPFLFRDVDDLRYAARRPPFYCVQRNAGCLREVTGRNKFSRSGMLSLLRMPSRVGLRARSFSSARRRPARAWKRSPRRHASPAPRRIS